MPIKMKTVNQKKLKTNSFLTVVLIYLTFQLYSQPYNVDAFESSKYIDPQKFADPPRGYRQFAWLTLNLSNATEESLDRQIKAWAERDLTGGFYLGMSGGKTSHLSKEYLDGSGTKPTDEGVAFLSPEYFKLYASAIESGLKYGNPPVVFYDEVGYPSGMAGGLLYTKYPQFAGKSLEKTEKDISGPSKTTIEIPEGNITIGAVMMNYQTKELVDISRYIKDGRNLLCNVPKGDWKIMAFYLNPKASLGQGRKSGYVDYLDKEAVKTFIDLVYQSHFDYLGKYFGNVLKITQYDEPAMHVSAGRAWTPYFNQRFKETYGFDPMKYYPALFYDIGPNTGAIRNLLWGFRAKLFSENYIKQMDDWCRAHGIMLSGHFDQEEIDNPVPVNGDFMLAFKYQQVPGIDDIWWWGRTNRAYKLVSSAAYNWDKPLFMAETYAAYRVMDTLMVYRVAMDQAAMGVNFQVGALPRTKTPESDRFIGRLCYMLQYGRHVADVAILYPIASLQAAYRFGNFDPSLRNAKTMETAYAREGGIVPPETDYIELGELIFRGIRQDFTFLHPEVLDERCIVKGNKLILNNEVNKESYFVLIIPGSRYLSVSNARKIRDFYNSGGIVIATKILPEKSAEIGRDYEVKKIMAEVFGVSDDQPVKASFQRRIDEFMVWFVNSNSEGGRAYFLPDYTPEMMEAIMREAIPVRDVEFEEPMWPLKIGPSYDGSLTYIHKVKDNRNIWFFANSSGKSINTFVTLRDSCDVALWNPMNGEIIDISENYIKDKSGKTLTRLPLNLGKVSALFYVENKR